MYKLLSHHCFAAEWQYELLSTKYCPQLEDLPDTLLKLSFSEVQQIKNKAILLNLKYIINFQCKHSKI